MLAPARAYRHRLPITSRAPLNTSCSGRDAAVFREPGAIHPQRVAILLFDGERALFNEICGETIGDVIFRQGTDFLAE